MAPSHAGMRDPLFLRDIEIDLIGDAGRIINDDPRSFVKRIKNLAEPRLATFEIQNDRVGALRDLMTGAARSFFFSDS